MSRLLWWSISATVASGRRLLPLAMAGNGEARSAPERALTVLITGPPRAGKGRTSSMVYADLAHEELVQMVQANREILSDDAFCRATHRYKRAGSLTNGTYAEIGFGITGWSRIGKAAKRRECLEMSKEARYRLAFEFLHRKQTQSPIFEGDVPFADRFIWSHGLDHRAWFNDSPHDGHAREKTALVGMDLYGYRWRPETPPGRRAWSRLIPAVKKLQARFKYLVLEGFEALRGRQLLPLVDVVVILHVSRSQRDMLWGKMSRKEQIAKQMKHMNYLDYLRSDAGIFGKGNPLELLDPREVAADVYPLNDSWTTVCRRMRPHAFIVCQVKLPRFTDPASANTFYEELTRSLVTLLRDGGGRVADPSPKLEKEDAIAAQPSIRRERASVRSFMKR